MKIDLQISKRTHLHIYHEFSGWLKEEITKERGNDNAIEFLKEIIEEIQACDISQWTPGTISEFGTFLAEYLKEIK